MMNTKQGSAEDLRLLFACSGASDVGHLTDLAARALAKDGVGKMYCLAGIGGRVEPMMNLTRSAKTLVALDGCAQECARKTLELGGFSGFEHLKLADLGFTKGQSPATPENVQAVVAKAAVLLRKG
jgi:uncharacterized metal-binding protein